ncbi:type II toxin-antitoxin system RatA family toxin [Thiohalobacter sp. IOR34]|uniref:type II toxin-antitoxin system RatA family toxin n=1 Tax=Thiohalobacter sp. IOR34 TaxID=3057176 RepID=UPI0025AEDA23|nr:type II toxin-antitoxin system RatA family toxin [Thiohalobacter sp. IOR34]WJW75975.1 type II toxin-antitoxin system RatA family toxin [Thiohalobacter sp. IOR34]
MSLCRERRLLPYAPDALFALIADIESYPRFVPGYLDARITRRQGDTLYVTQTLGMGPARLQLDTIARLDPPHAIHIRSPQGAPVRVAIDWRLDPVGEGCRLEFTAEGQARNPLLDGLLQRWFQWSNRRLLAAFEQEARRRLTPRRQAGD